MKHGWIYIGGLLLAAILALEILQFRNINTSSGNASNTEFLPMVYENQVYHAASTDGLDIYSPEFHVKLHERNVEQPVLVFRYSGQSCKGCVQSCINALRRQCPDFESNDRIMVVISDAAQNQILPGSLVLESGQMLGYDVEGTRIPHFFVYDPMRQEILHTFLPDQSDPNALTIYLSTIMGRYGI